MPLDVNNALLVIQQQLKELDVIYRDTLQMSLNTVAVRKGVNAKASTAA